jgi:hypothetical protein
MMNGREGQTTCDSNATDDNGAAPLRPEVSMPIPNVSAEALRDAMAQFDRELRHVPDWADWEA